MRDLLSVIDVVALSLVAYGPALLWAAVRADLTLLWLVLGVFAMVAGFLCIVVSYTDAASTHEWKGSALAEPPSVHAHRRRVTQVIQVLFLAVWLFAWRGLAG